MTTQRLKPIIDRICKRAGLSPTLVNSAALRKVDLQGYAITGDVVGTAAIEQLMGLFQFYTTETDSQLLFGLVADAANAGVINPDHIGVMRDNADGGGVITTRRESDMPRKYELTFSDPALAYRENVAAAYRLTAASEKVERFSVALVVPYERAEQICNAALTASWAARTSTELQVPLEYAHVQAGDTVEFDGALWRVTRVQFNAPLAIKLNLSKFSFAPFNAITAPATAEVILPPTVDKVQPVPVMLDIQLLNEDTDSSGFYLAAYCPKGKVSARYATLAIKDIDGTYEQKAAVAVGIVAGSLVSALPPGAATTFDATTTLQVMLDSDGALYSCTFEEALNGKNRVLIGNEIAAYTTATLDSTTGNYTLSGLVRGLGGSAPGAAAGARFVELTKNFVGNVAMATDTTGSVKSYKLLGQDLPEDSATEFQFTNTNQRLRPLQPVHLSATPSTTGRLLDWTRQARKSYAWLNETDVPLDYARERYEVQFLNGSGSVIGATYTLNNATQLDIAIPTGAEAFQVRQLGDLLPGPWAVANIT